jgi:hypothetical protein
MKIFMPISVVVYFAASSLSLGQTMAPAAPTGVAQTGTAKPMSDCEANWVASDRNGDGLLDSAETAASNALIPITLAGKTGLNKQEFLSACDMTFQNAIR